MANSTLKISVEKDERTGVSIVECCGALDAANLKEFKNAVDPLFHDSDSDVIIDCGNIIYASSQVFGLFSCYYKINRSKDKIFALCSASSQVSNILDILGLSNIFNIYDTRQDALEQAGVLGEANDE